MLKSELIGTLVVRLHDVPPRDVELGVTAILNALTEALASGRRVELRGFGSFETHMVAARQGRNPKTGDTVAVPARLRIAFKAGKDLRQQVAPDRNRQRASTTA